MMIRILTTTLLMIAKKMLSGWMTPGDGGSNLSIIHQDTISTSLDPPGALYRWRPEAGLVDDIWSRCFIPIRIAQAGVTRPLRGLLAGGQLAPARSSHESASPNRGTGGSWPRIHLSNNFVGQKSIKIMGSMKRSWRIFKMKQTCTAQNIAWINPCCF